MGKPTNERRSDEPRRHRFRRLEDWNDVKALLINLAAVATALSVAVGFLLTILGGRFTWNADDIRVNSIAIDSLRAANVLIIRRQDSSDAKMSDLIYINCALYAKNFPQGLPPKTCPKETK